MEKEFYVHLFHIILVGGLFYYIGTRRDKMPKIIYPFLIVLGCFIILYHIYKSLYKKDAWVNHMHILLIGPILIIIGIYGETTPRKFFEIILMLAFAVIGYHLYYMLTE